MRTLDEMKELVACGLGEETCDYKLTNLQLVNVVSEEIYKTNIYIKNKRIVSIDPDADLKYKEEIDLQGQYVLPGFIDTHMHFESTMLSPEILANIVVPTGTTTLMADLMEIANVAGEEGLKEMLNSSADLPYRMLIEVSSRVPTAPGLETSGAVLGAAEIEKLMAWENSISLGEMDSSKILITREDQYLEKILSALKRKKVVNGHAIGRLGQELNVFASSGISDDHECVTSQEMIERLRVGMKILIREGSSERNVDELMSAVVKEKLPTGNLMFCTDDKHINDIQDEGHIDYNVNRSIELGLSPMKAIQLATFNAAKHFRVDEEIGSVTPGRMADLLITESLKKIKATQVWYEGKPVAKEGKIVKEVETRKYPDWIKNTVILKNEITPQSFEIKDKKEGRDKADVHIIELIKDQIINTAIEGDIPVKNGFLQNDLVQDFLKISVIERYGVNGNVGLGYVKGFGLKEGAIAYSMAHDHHNIVIVGTNDEDMSLCANHLAKIKGGACAVKNGKVLADMSLPIGGLMSEKGLEEVQEELELLNAKAKELGCPLSAPFMSLSFVSLPTVPELGLTDLGLIDVIDHKIIDIFRD